MKSILKTALVFVLFEAYSTNALQFGIPFENFYNECPCLMAHSAPIKTVTANSLNLCYLACMTASDCYAFSYCDISKQCSVYNGAQTAINSDTFPSLDCEGTPSEPVSSNRKWYLRYRIENGLTTGCSHIRQADPNSADGYYEVRLHGIKITVFCVMREPEQSTLTFVDIHAETTLFDAAGNPNYVKKEFTKARIIYSSCVAGLQANAFTFSTQTGNNNLFIESHAGIAQGRSCGSGVGEEGKSIVDLTGTRLKIPEWLSFEYRGDNPSGGTNSRSEQYLDSYGEMLTVVQHARIQNQKIDNERQIGQRKESKEKMKHHNTRLGPENPSAMNKPFSGQFAVISQPNVPLRSQWTPAVAQSPQPQVMTLNNRVQALSVLKKDLVPEWALAQYDAMAVRSKWFENLVTGKAKLAIAGFLYSGRKYKDALKIKERKMGEPENVITANLEGFQVSLNSECINL
ncbi:uncharacterized protein LOC134851949 [Symsagittifera roscoffensis]|uniref:uncharacterized protein LOC134851949 n=1 Tax=Symsagittifera roscoffensis TaxID=84072 RepID=UPI00307B623A